MGGKGGRRNCGKQSSAAATERRVANCSGQERAAVMSAAGNNRNPATGRTGKGETKATGGGTATKKTTQPCDRVDGQRPPMGADGRPITTDTDVRGTRRTSVVEEAARTEARSVSAWRASFGSVPAPVPDPQQKTADRSNPTLKALAPITGLIVAVHSFCGGTCQRSVLQMVNETMSTTDQRRILPDPSAVTCS